MINNSEQTQQVEMDLASLTFGSIQDRLPNIVEFYLGFEVLTIEKDGTKVAGLAGFQIGREIVYIPSIFLGGQIKGNEMLYIKSSDTFVYGSQQWVEYLKRRTAMIIGDPKAKKNVSQARNLRIFRNPQVGGSIKYAMEQTSEVSSPINLAEFFRAAGPEIYRGFVKWAHDNHPDWLVGMVEMHGSDINIHEFPEAKSAAAEIMDTPKVPVKIYTPETKEAADLDDSTKEYIVSEGIYVDDSRPKKSKSKVHREIKKLSFYNPTKNGFFSVVGADMNTKDAFVAVRMSPIQDVKKVCDVGSVITPEGKVYLKRNNSTDPTQDWRPVVTAIEELDGDALKRRFKKKKAFSELKPLSRYVAVRPGGWISLPFEVMNRTSDAVCVFEDYTDSIYDPFTGSSSSTSRGGKKKVSESPGSQIGSGTWVRILKGASEPVSTASGTFLPEDVFFVEVNTSDYDTMSLDDIGEQESSPERTKWTPAKGSAVETAWSRAFVKTAAWKEPSGSGFRMHIGEGKTAAYDNREQFVTALVYRLGIDGKEAVDLSSELRRRGRMDFHVELPEGKIANDIDLDIDDIIGETEYSGTPIKGRVTEFRQSNPDYEEKDDPWDPAHGMAETLFGDNLTDNDMNVIDRAITSGNKGIFDSAMVGVILRSRRVDSAITSRYLPDMLKFIDSSCRLLLSFYWHRSSFEEIYGRKDLAEFEEFLLDSIKCAGTTALFLKQKDLGSSSVEIDAFSDF